LQLGMWVDGAVRVLAQLRSQRGDLDGGSRTMIAALAFSARVLVWAVLFAMALSSLGFEVSALVTGLGIGGVAAALAVQNVLGDLLASLSIFFDRPFEIGDYIVTGTASGTVEHIGVRSTRVRALEGHLLVIPNSDLARSRISNYRRLSERRALTAIGVEYSTPADVLEEIPRILRGIVESREGVRFDRAHFKTFGPSALEFELVYFVRAQEYVALMDQQQAVNLAIVRAFEARNISFAFPTSTVFLRPGGDWGEVTTLGRKHT
jgi:small-conductance mechanosensitive channel